MSQSPATDLYLVAYQFGGAGNLFPQVMVEGLDDAKVILRLEQKKTPALPHFLYLLSLVTEEAAQ